MEYPTIYYSFDEFYIDFYDGSIDLEKYRLLFNSGYYLSASKVIKRSNNYGTLRLTNSSQLPYCNPCYGKSYSPEIISHDKVLSKSVNYTNHFYIDFENWNSDFDSKDYFLFIEKDRLGNYVSSVYFNSLNIGDLTTIGLYPEDYSKGDFISPTIPFSSKEDNINYIVNSLKLKGFKVYRESEYLYVFYKDEYFPSINYSRGFIIGEKEEYESDILSRLTESNKIIEFYSITSGRSSRYINIDTTESNILLVKYNEEIKERYYYNTLTELEDLINKDSEYLSCKLFKNTSIPKGIYYLNDSS
jgi:hypothetical protein